jgi:hypothetical protein
MMLRIMIGARSMACHAVDPGKNYIEQRDYYGLVELEIVDRHIAGFWQVLRFIGMFCIIGAILAIVFRTEIRLAVSNRIQQALSVVPTLSSVAGDRISSLLPDLLLIIFIIFAEGVNWWKRAQMGLGIRALEMLEDNYTLCPRPER